MKIAFLTLGCKVNQYETQLLKGMFKKSGFEIVDCYSYADIYVINSCTVTANSDFKIRQFASRFSRINQKAIKVLVGCFVQAFKDKPELFSKFDVVVGNSNKFELPKILNDFLSNKKHTLAVTEHVANDYKSFNLTIDEFQHRFRAFVKIEDGCNRYCSYCIIPIARGFIKSKPLDILKREVENLAANFYTEIVLVGINVSSYGFDLRNMKIGLADAVDVVSSVVGIKRIRLGSLEPDLLSFADVLRYSHNEKFCPNFHISLQSGSDSVLQRMGRRYNTYQYRKLVEDIFNKFENPSITTDIMVGFPQESEAEFQQTLKFIETIGFLKVHIFPYSRRPGTKAAQMSGQLTKAEKKLRVNVMKEIVGNTTKKFLDKQLGKVLNVLFEELENNNVYIGHSKNYVLVKVVSMVDLCGKIKNVKIIKAFDDYCIGEIL